MVLFKTLFVPFIILLSFTQVSGCDYFTAETKELQVDADDPWPWSFSGEMSCDYSAEAKYGANGTSDCSGTGTIQITLSGDESATGSAVGSFSPNYSFNSDGTSPSCTMSVSGISLSGTHWTTGEDGNGLKGTVELFFSGTAMLASYGATSMQGSGGNSWPEATGNGTLFKSKNCNFTISRD